MEFHQEIFFKSFQQNQKLLNFAAPSMELSFQCLPLRKSQERKLIHFTKLIAASGKEPKWNFAKYLIGRDGQVIEHYKSSVTPESERLVSAIQAVL